MKKNDLKKLALMIVYWCAVLGMIILTIGLTVNAAKFARQMGYDIFHSVPSQENSTEKIVVTVPENCTVPTMASALKKQGLIRNELAFYVQSILYGYKLVPGEYVISPSMTGIEILKTLSNDIEIKE